MFIVALFTIATTWDQPKCPSMIDCIKKMWHIYTTEYYAAIKNEFVSFSGIWMKLEAIILSKLTGTENQTPHFLPCKWEFNNENTWTQGGKHHTPGTVVGSGPRGGGGGEGLPGEKCQMWVKGRKQTKHTAICVPMQISCMFCTCTLKPKMQ